jgi:ABC-type polysaccharide/polyol phosphate export permease
LSTKARSSAKPGSWRAILGSLATFYEQRWLIKYFVQRQMVSGYRGSYLGIAWALLGPLLMVIMLTLIFSEVIGIRFREVTGDSTLNFGLFLYCGLIPFLAYQQAMVQGVNVIRRNSDLVQKVVFPMEILPLTTVLTSLLQNTFGLGALMLVLAVVDQRLHWTILLLPLVIIPQLLFTLGLGYLMAVAGTYVPDVRDTLRTFVRGTFWITPIIWPAGRVPENLSFLVDYNPLAFLVGAYRALILDGVLPGPMASLYFSLFAVAMFSVGFVVFNRVKHNFADQL